MAGRFALRRSGCQCWITILLTQLGTLCREGSLNLRYPVPLVRNGQTSASPIFRFSGLALQALHYRVSSLGWRFSSKRSNYDKLCFNLFSFVINGPTLAENSRWNSMLGIKIQLGTMDLDHGAKHERPCRLTVSPSPGTWAGIYLALGLNLFWIPVLNFGHWQGGARLIATEMAWYVCGE